MSDAIGVVIFIIIVSVVVAPDESAQRIGHFLKVMMEAMR